MRDQYGRWMGDYMGRGHRRRRFIPPSIRQSRGRDRLGCCSNDTLGRLEQCYPYIDQCWDPYDESVLDPCFNPCDPCEPPPDLTQPPFRAPTPPEMGPPPYQRPYEPRPSPPSELGPPRVTRPGPYEPRYWPDQGVGLPRTIAPRAGGLTAGPLAILQPTIY